MEGKVLEVDTNLTTLELPTGKAQLVVLEDNDAVIKMTVKGRTPAMRHIQRTHRVDIDWLFERFQSDPSIYIRYVNTKSQTADLLTKGAFTSLQWNALCELAQVGTPGETLKTQTSSTTKAATAVKDENGNATAHAGGDSTLALNAGGDSSRKKQQGNRAG